MLLADLLRRVPTVDVSGDADPVVDHVTRDSRDAGPRSVFVAVPGANVDGHRFAASVDAAAVVVERDVPVRPGAVRVRVADSRRALAEVAAGLHGHPSEHVRVVGVTGTNGKTTITTVLEQAWQALGRPCARVGTTGWSVDGEPRPTAFTTPEAPALQALLGELRDRGIGRLALEVSSIGLALDRVWATQVHTAVFTNLTRDHLDFHGTLDAYADAKARLFRELLRPSGGAPRAVLSRDDPAWARMGAPGDAWTYGFDPAADVRITQMTPRESGTVLRLESPAGSATVTSRLVGRYNAQNMAAAFSVLLADGVLPADAARALDAVSGVPGRLELVPNERGVRVLVDYAHSDDALRQALGAVRAITDGRVWVVFGCGGDRDRTKRAPMGQVARALADRVVVTSDNPRTEDPLRIVDDVLSGIADRDGVYVEPDRRAAIALALAGARAGDAVLIAGKGHERTQTIAGRTLPFDDREVARALLEGA